MNRLKNLFVLSLMGGSILAFALDSGGEVACASFAGDRRVAEISIETGSLHLGVSDGGKSESAPIEQIGFEPSNCEAFFSQNDQWLAIGVERPLGSNWGLHVLVWDVNRREWHKSFDIDPRPGLTGYVSLAGFYRGQTKLAVIGRQDDGRSASLTSALVSLEGKVLDGPGYPRNWPAEADAQRDRVWTSGGPDGCLMSSFPLIGTVVKGSQVIRPGIQGSCSGPSPIGFPEENMIIGAAGDGQGRTWAWRVSIDTDTKEKTSLESTSKRAGDKWVQAVVQPFLSISQDGKFFAIQRTTTHWSHFDNPREMVNEIVVGEVQPLRFLQVLKPKACSSVSAFAIGYHDDAVEVVGRWCGEWKTNAVAVPDKKGDIHDK